MATVLNRITKEIRYSVNTPDYPDSTWIINPDLSAVQGIPQRYWKIVGNSVVEMNQSEKDATDAVILPYVREERKRHIQESANALIIKQGYTVGMQRSMQVMYADGLRIRPNQMNYAQRFVDWVRTVDMHVKSKHDLIDDTTSVDVINSIDIDSSVIIGSDPSLTISEALDTTDSSFLNNFLDGNAIVTDPYTGVSGPFYLMQELVNRRELFNDSTNPLYVANHTPILGESGYLADHANRILNIETIHEKLGWHGLQVKQALYRRPKDMLFYYGYPNSFNSATNQWNNEKVAQDMAKYEIIVLGDGVENPSHPDYANSSVIISRIKQLNPRALIFGYVTLAQDSSAFRSKVDQWDILGIHGIFVDEAGYDYGKTRAEFNSQVDFIHSRTTSNIVFANAWNTDHILGVENDPSYPNSVYNPNLLESHLTKSDWVLLESFPVNTEAYAGSGNKGYEPKTSWLNRGQKAVGLRAEYGVNLATLNVINNNVAPADGTTLSQFAFLSSLMFNVEGYGTSDVYYGASSASVKWWLRPDTSNLNTVYEKYPSVQVDALDSDVYYRYVENARISLDFSNDAQTSSITKY